MYNAQMVDEGAHGKIEVLLAIDKRSLEEVGVQHSPEWLVK